MSNKAAWLTAAQAKPLEVGDAPMPKAGSGQVVIKNAAAAVNPVDWKVQDFDFYINKFPNILGTDVAGEIHEIGSGVTDFEVGQRVIGHACNLRNSDPAEGGFQLYTACPSNAVSRIPSTLSFTQAAVLPLAISTAAEGLYRSDILSLPYPTISSVPHPINRIIIILGGSSSVGGLAVQLAHASGLTVIATASPKNHEYVKSLGASEVFDQNSPSLVLEIVTKYSGSDFAGTYDAISATDTVKTAVSITSHLGGGKIALTLPPPEDLQLPENVTYGNCMAFALPFNFPEIARAVWKDFVPEALERGQLRAEPKALVLKGLEKVQEGMDKLKEGVSAQKLVIEL